MKQHRPCHFRVVIFLLAATCGGIANAAIVMTVESKGIASDPVNPLNGFFDVFFNVTGDNPAVAGYQLRLDLLPAGAGVSLGAPVSTNTGSPVRPPFFSTPPIDLGSTASRIQVTDYLPTGAKAIADLEGLVRIPFTVAASARGIFDVIIHQTQTALSDAAGGPIPFQSVNGRLVVEPVPEPSSLVLVVTACSAGLVARWRMRGGCRARTLDCLRNTARTTNERLASRLGVAAIGIYQGI